MLLSNYKVIKVFNFPNLLLTLLYYYAPVTSTMAPQVTFSCEDARYKKKVPVVKDQEDVEMESAEEAAQVTQAPRFECASL